jgi:hypothetical protein
MQVLVSRLTLAGSGVLDLHEFCMPLAVLATRRARARAPLITPPRCACRSRWSGSRFGSLPGPTGCSRGGSRPHVSRDHIALLSGLTRTPRRWKRCAWAGPGEEGCVHARVSPEGSTSRVAACHFSYLVEKSTWLSEVRALSNKRAFSCHPHKEKKRSCTLRR